MEERDLDCLVLWGWPLMWDFCIANARYLCPVGGNAEFNVLVFPREGEPTCFVQMPTFVEAGGGAGLGRRHPSAQRHLGGQRRRPPQELKLDAAHRHGRARRPARSRRLAAAQRLYAAEGAAARRNLVNLDDMLEKVRTIKSAEEIGARQGGESSAT